MSAIPDEVRLSARAAFDLPNKAVQAGPRLQSVAPPEPIFCHPAAEKHVPSGSKEVLVVSEDAPARAMIVFGLCCAGFAVREMAEISLAQREAVRRPPDLILLKVEEFVGQAFTFTQVIKRHSQTHSRPLMVLSKRSGDNLSTLEAGADDQMSLPLAPGELIARIQALLRQSSTGIAQQSIQLGGLTLNPVTHRVSVGSCCLHAPPREYKFLELLLRNPERIFSRSELFRLIWGEQAEIDERTVDVYVLRTRKILASAGKAHLLQTVRGVGYYMSATELRKA